MTSPQEPLTLALVGGGVATVLDTDGARAALDSTAPYPPGSTLKGEASDGLGTYLLKVRSCRREPPSAPETAITTPSRYRVEGRWVNLSRSQRERLLGPTAARA
jgi:hypothetical protein